MGRINEFVTTRRDNYKKLLYLALIDTETDFFYLLDTPNNYYSPFGFPIILSEAAPFSANEMIAYLESKKIYTRRFFAGNIIKQPGYKHKSYVYKDLVNTDYIMNNGFWIGCHPGITNQMLQYMIEMISEFIRKYQ